MEKIKKIWGSETTWTQSQNYVSSFLLINPGYRISKNKFSIQEQSLYVQEGGLLVWLSKEENDIIFIRSGTSYHIPEKKFYRYGAPVEQGFPTSLIKIGIFKKSIV
tara:strand:- start:131 stop:448 length:318 start_codon:yes stop_codon:yes gene_type:complete